ncbi:hypothetical protein [Streptomyces albipurpureus]|uniref:Uncharacterized protein n=1 Tax=Streptomyces albipurpureus TaxID=2897419 RepID=A0ABT0UPU7_9ACTN|nr:hypothetical protein [Streptomyces sp. CWNU-1]MCM2389378.1 hypothetical protein [Streptomyces sp. CWNU-1]
MSEDWNGPDWRLNLPESWLLCGFLKPDPTLRSWGACHHWAMLELQLMGVIEPVSRTKIEKKYVLFGPLEPVVSHGFGEGPQSHIHLPDYFDRAKDRVLSGMRSYAASPVLSQHIYHPGMIRENISAGGQFNRELVRSLADHGLLRIKRDNWSGVSSKPTGETAAVVGTVAYNITRARDQFPGWVRTDRARALDFTRRMGALALMVPAVHKSWRPALRELFRGASSDAVEQSEGARLADATRRAAADEVRSAVRSEVFGGLADGFYDQPMVDIADGLLSEADFSGVWDFAGVDGGGDGGGGGD